MELGSHNSSQKQFQGIQKNDSLHSINSKALDQARKMELETAKRPQIETLNTISVACGGVDMTAKRTRSPGGN